MKIKLFYIVVFLVFTGCKTEKISLKFLNEFIVKDSLVFENTIVGGISGIDFSNNQYYMVVDDSKNPRILVGDILIKDDSIESVEFKQTIKVDSVSQFYKDNVLDLESIFVVNDQINLVSEGSIRKGKSPVIFTVNSLGKIQDKIKIPSYFKANSLAKPKHNATFESSSKSIDKKGYWVAMEGPLAADGEEPTFHKTESPIRITYFNNETKKATKQFTYQLEKITKPAKGTVNLNGVTAILEYTKNSFFVIERIYQSGYGTQGNTIRIFKATIDDDSTNSLNIESLKKQEYIPLKKELLFDFESIQGKLTDTIIDNIEGITFGPELSNGNQSLIVVSDDNFQVYGKQLNQFILLEIQHK
ncbi:esterase-like activity of phytase family protein [Tenacibaculum ovolyticum]|uniref:esterase-like activity of phytase family protein n=1 Tax=Tenacibaculum ovolyticum TaxID=104270 RepID=UPI0004214546|nr:esterase-like activity of phytase family protein [Tenacibaculum ovolyticum]